MDTAATSATKEAATKETISRRAASKFGDWRLGSFGPASEEPYRRRTSDWIRVIIAATVLGILIVHQGQSGAAEGNLFRFFNGLPDDFRSFFEALYRFGSLWAIGIVLAATLVARRWRLSRDLLLAGVIAWFLARLISALVAQHASLSQGLDIATRLGDDTLSFPLTRLAVIAAVISAASPYLARPMRRLGQFAIVVMALAAMYLGTGLPDGIIAAIALGWGVAAAVHLVFGSPGGRPTRAQVAAALGELGFLVTDIELTPKQPADAAVMSAGEAGGPLTLRLLGRDQTDAQLVRKFWRGLLFKDSGPSLRLTRESVVEHEAYMLLLAARSGARVPDVVIAGKAGPGIALIATRLVDGARLDDAGPEALTDDSLSALWDQVGHLRDTRIAHNRLNARHVVLGHEGPALVDFVDASPAATSAEMAADAAELLFSTALVVGDDRAIRAAVQGIGRDGVVEALRFLQPAVVSAELRPRKRSAKKEFKHRLDALRAAAAAATGVEEPPLEQLYRVNSQSLMMAVGTLIAVFALLSQIGDPEEFWNTIKNADVGWLLAALFVSFITNFATSFSLMGTVPISLPLLRTAELQLSMSFSNLAVPAVGGLAAQVRFLQLQGLDLASAVASGGLLSNVGNVTACLILFVIALALSPTSLDFGNVDTSGIGPVILLVGVIILFAIGLIYKVPKIRDKVLPPIKSAATTMREALRSPKRVMLLLGGNMLNSLLYGFVLLACIMAFGGSIDFWTLLALNIVIGTLASLVPVPGGGTAVSSIGMTGALTAVGISTEVAVAAVLLNQLVSCFIPAVPGWFATKNLIRDGYL